jgi:hypothetical protein
MTVTPEPTYPTYNRASTAWRTFAAAVAVSATLWLPACGDDADNRVAVPGGMQPIQVVNPVDEPKPPEAVVKPPEEPVAEPRLSGARVEPAPPVRPAGGPPPVQP